MGRFPCTSQNTYFRTEWCNWCKYQPWVYSLVVSLQDNIKGKQVKAVMILLFVLLDSYEICSDVMFLQRQILYFLYPSSPNHELVSRPSSGAAVLSTLIKLAKSINIPSFPS